MSLKAGESLWAAAIMNPPVRVSGTRKAMRLELLRVTKYLPPGFSVQRSRSDRGA